MKIPRKIRLGARTVKIIHKKMDSFGESDYARSTIWLRRGMTQEAKEATLIHEIFHLMNVTMPHTTLDSLAEQWYAALKDNNMLK